MQDVLMTLLLGTLRSFIFIQSVVNTEEYWRSLRKKVFEHEMGSVLFISFNFGWEFFFLDISCSSRAFLISHLLCRY